jgi:hypothetical protein
VPVDPDGFDHMSSWLTTAHAHSGSSRFAAALLQPPLMRSSALGCYACPRLVLSDNGPEFQGDPWTRLARQYGFYHSTIAPRNARANGIVERLIRDIKDRALRIGAADGRNWARGFSVFELLFGQQPLLPAAARLGTDSHIRRLHATTDADLYKRTNRTIAERLDIVNAEQQHASAMRIRSAAPAAAFSVGDVVSIANLDNRQSKFAAWSQSGKYEAFQLQRPDGSHVSMFVPARFLKRWHGDRLRSPLSGERRHDDFERQREQSERFQQATDEHARRAAELLRRGIDRFAASPHAYSTQVAIDNFIKHDQPLSTSSSRLDVHSTIPSTHSLKSIFKSIHYIVVLNDDSFIITTPSALSNSTIRQFNNHQRAARGGGKM